MFIGLCSALQVVHTGFPHPIQILLASGFVCYVVDARPSMFRD